jgi:cholesterol oxidase
MLRSTDTATAVTGLDYDWLVIGSGFGGSVSALRLAEKGYRVGVLEAGRRFRDEDFPKTTWDAKNFTGCPRWGSAASCG